MNMKDAIVAALRRDPELVPKLAGTLKERIAEEEGPASTVVQAAASIEPILADAVRRRPSRLGRLGLNSAHLLASLAVEDARSNRLLANLGRGGPIGIAFVDVADFVAYTERHGDDSAIALVNRLSEIVQAAIRPVNGAIVKRLGDGFLLAFPSASQALRGAVAIRDASGRGRGRRAEPPVDVRIAVHAGEPLIDRDDLLGHDVNLTARLLDHCRPGEVVVSEAAKELAERRLKKIRFGRRRQLKIRGLAGRVPVYSVRHA
jgi:class 3 adenylate cyclase